MVVVNDYATNMTILNSPHFDRSRVTGQVFDNIVPTGQIAIPSNDMWKRHRRAMAPAMSAKSLEMMTPRVLSTVRELVELCEAKRLKADGRPWEIADDFVSAAMVSWSRPH
jgi:cytochrome P450